MATRIAGFRGEFLWELDIAERQLVAIAECIPAEPYDWRPVAQAPPFNEVFVHVATGNFMLLYVIVAPATCMRKFRLAATRDSRAN